MSEEMTYLLFKKGHELLEQGNPAQAAIVLERARKMEPGKGSILEILGRAYYGYGRFGQAARSFEEALEVDPTNDYAHFCLGLCYVKLGRLSEAGGHFKLAWYMKPGDMYEEMAARYGA